MTTTLMPPESVAAALRVLPIGVNLLPAEIVEARQSRRTRFTVLGALAGVVVLLAAWFGLAMFQTAGARDDLAGAQYDAQRLTLQQKNYTNLVTTQARSQAIAAELSSLLSGDLQWSKLLSALQDAAPGGVTVTGVNGTLLTAASAAGTTRLPGLDDKPVGTLTVNGTGPSRAVVASYVDALSRVPGLANPLVTSASLENGVVHFSVQLDITKARLGGRFSSPSPSASAATR